MLLFFTIAPVLSTLLGGFAAIRLHQRIHPLMAFAAGVVITTALADLLPEGSELMGEGVSRVAIAAVMVAGYLAFTAIDAAVHGESLEHADVGHPAHEGHEHSEAQPHILGLLPSLGFVLHSLLDGVAIGLGFAHSPELGLLVGIAVLAHDFADGMNVVTLVLAARHGMRPAIVLLVIDALAPAVGVVVSSLITVSAAALGVLLVGFAGVFLSIGATHLLPEAQHGHPGPAPRLVLAATIGAAFVLVVQSLVG